MAHHLFDLLICPDCLPAEKPLKWRESAGALLCRACGRDYPVVGGVVRMASGAPAGEGYEGRAMLAAYLWSHYADLWGDPEASGAYARWAALMPVGGLFLDAGCAVGRMAFEMSAKAELSVGLDLSRAFTDTAARLVRGRGLGFGLPVEGRLCEPKAVSWQEHWRAERVAFVQADALALPFPASLFDSVSSLNLLDKVPDPLRHLTELDRVAARQGAFALVADPYSWSRDAAPEDKWLGGTDAGPWAGRGRENAVALMARDMEPAWEAGEMDETWWTIRHHANRFERIRSLHFTARR